MIYKSKLKAWKKNLFLNHRKLVELLLRRTKLWINWFFIFFLIINNTIKELSEKKY